MGAPTTSTSASRMSSSERIHVEYCNVLLFELAPQPQIESLTYQEPARMVVMLSGAISASWDLASGPRGRMEAKPGDVILWPARFRHLERNSSRKAPLRCIAVDFHWMHPTANLPVVVPDRQSALRVFANSLLLAKDSHLPQRRAVLNALIAGMLAEYLRLAGPIGDEVVDKAIWYVHSHMQKPIYLENLARAAGLKKTYFCRRYRAVTGRSPMQDVRRMRAEHAAGLLRVTDYPLKAVAAMVGLADEHQLSKLLKSCLGITAREIRAAIARQRASAD